MSWYLKALKNYVNFSGRSRRKEYWMFVLFNMVIAIIVNIIDMLTGAVGMLYLAYILVIILPSLAVLVRRLHDIGKSGLWLLLMFVPLFGPITLIIFACMESEPNTNRYGHNPRFDS